LGRTITAGDAYGRNSETIENIIQTDAAINPGNSGGPLLDHQGRVVGVNVATSGADNVSFALPIEVVKESLGVFESTGRFDRPYLGVSYQMISERAALLNEIPQGAYITGVGENTAAGTAGLKEGDVITSFGGESLKIGEVDEAGQNKLTSLINQHKVGDRVEIEYYREGEKQTVTVTLGKRE
jgi:serine protease Do